MILRNLSRSGSYLQLAFARGAMKISSDESVEFQDVLIHGRQQITPLKELWGTTVEYGVQSFQNPI